MSRFVFLSHSDFNLYRFRLPILKALLAEGHEVVALCPAGRVSPLFARHGISHEAYEVDRVGTRLWSELAVVRELGRILRRLRPRLVHTFTHKPNIYGSLASRGIRDVAIVNSVTGLGSMYLGPASVIRSGFMNLLYRVAVRRSAAVVFQNKEDREFFVDRGIVRPEQAVVIRGSGVDTEVFRPSPRTDRAVVTVTMVARLIRDKGVEEYVEAARRIRAELGSGVRFWLVGSPDPGNPRSMPEEWVSAVRREGVVDVLGEREDIPEILSATDVYCLPSYREGLPMSVLEAMASGLPVVTTDVPGCRETTEDGVNGWRVPPGDLGRLVDALRRLIADADRREVFGAESRKKAEKEFSVARVVRQHLELYDRVVAGMPWEG